MSTTVESKRSTFLVFGSPRLEEDEINEVVQTLHSGWIGTGPRVAQFERDFAAYKGGSYYPVAMNSCTAALHISMIAAGLQPGDEVITSALTFCATVNAIIHAGLTPVIADVDPLTMNIDPEDVLRRITSKTRAIIPVHFAGRSCDMNSLMRIAEKYGLKVIEDCAHAIETTYEGKPVGTFGDFGCFSFYVTKNITTGEGGLVLTRRQQDANRCKVLALHGMSIDAWKRFGDSGYKHYDVVECGFKYNMTDLQAAIGIWQLRRVEDWWQRRKNIFLNYNESLARTPLQLPTNDVGCGRHAYHLYTILVDETRTGIGRDAFLAAMAERNIGVGVHYRSIAEHPYYRTTFGWRPEAYPNAMRIGRQTVSLPVSAKLNDEDIEDVVNAVHHVLRSR